MACTVQAGLVRYFGGVEGNLSYRISVDISRAIVAGTWRPGSVKAVSFISGTSYHVPTVRYMYLQYLPR